ncbi:MAG TPA: molybdopterin-dependent oxidoreductase [Propionibacteriaceae bacterium]
MPTQPLFGSRPTWWPHFSSTVRSTALTARVGRALGIAIGVCFVTGLLSHYQYQPWSWLPQPASPVWGFRLTQGIHVATGTAAIPLVLVKLWTVYPNLFRWPPVRSLKHAVERGTVALLVGATLVQLSTGFFNALNWYPFRWDFVAVHRFLAYVVVGSILLHIAVKLPDIVYGLQTKVADGDVLTEIPWSENPDAHSNAGDLPAPVTPGLSRRGVLTAAGAGIGVVVVTSVGQTLTPLEPLGLLAIRQGRKGPQGVPVNRTAEQAAVIALATATDWALQVTGPQPYDLSVADVEAMAEHEARFPINCVEGWSVGANWRGLKLLDVVVRAGGTADSRVWLHSLEPAGVFNNSYVEGPQLSKALLATHLNGQRLDIDHGYPLRLIAPNRAGVLNTKWLARIEVL